ncbi:ABC transporter ATP-binding protein [Streptomyces sp. VMFN-G11Ma]|uniref:ABC transporter ATP-binding protein n=1 Tax=Streptomyces sp. VMFN-G11Ma TaxID=2135609 RepID=UPI000D33C8D2|nr:ATP-binding cassette domain-containing protein [Streptomyces sp. VMFN-G11Ma]PTN00457.1 ABC-type multidrug transport system ATPase subunit [Streptomyces sp. VMFN-G11Ma]
MIQVFGLTSMPRKGFPCAVDDVSFDAHSGRLTTLLGTPGAGKTTALRLMLELQQGRGITHFRGRPLHRIAHPSREVGVLLGDVPGHPARTVRGHLRLLCAAAGVSTRRADEVMEAVGLAGLRDERLGTLSRGMDRRLGLACALLPDPHTLVLDEPADGLSAREVRWLYGMLRAHAARGGTVLLTTADPKEAARGADRVVTLEQGRVVADQDAEDFARTRLRPRVAVRSPHAARLAALLTKEARNAQRSVEVVREGGNRLSVYGSSCADIGETAFRHGILVHQLADEIGDMGPGATDTLVKEPATTTDPSAPQRQNASGAARDRIAAPHSTLSVEEPSHAGTQPPSVTPDGAAHEAHSDADTSTYPDADPDARPGTYIDAYPDAHPGTYIDADPDAHSDTHPDARPHVKSAPDPEPLSPVRADDLSSSSSSSSPLPPPISVRSAPSPLRPLRYEIRRAAGISTGFLTGAAVLVVSALAALFLARSGHTPQERLLVAWPQELPLPPAALGAGLLGALAFGDEFRHPALAADRGTVPRRLGLLVAKLLVATATALMLAFLTVGCDAEMLYIVYGRELTQVPADWLSLSASWFGLVVGCAWAGVLAAGVFRSTTAGLAAVVAVPVVVVPLVQKALAGSSVRTAAGFPLRLREVLLTQWPFGGERYLSAVARVVAQPVGGALTLSLTALLCAYLLTTLRSRFR